jgi:hypothetical protein
VPGTELETCRRRLHEWIERGVWEQALALLVAELDRQGRPDWTRVVVDASIVDAKKGRPGWAEPGQPRLSSQ